MKTGIYWQDPKYAVGSDRRATDPALVLDLPLYKLDGASFRSKDACGHLCTVTGALWTPQGRSFDGSDDYVDCGSAPSLLPDIATVEAWVKYDGSGSWIPLIAWKAGSDRPGIMIRATAAPIIYLGSSNYKYFLNDPIDIYDNEWHHIVFVLTGYGQDDILNAKMYADGGEQAGGSTSNAGLPDAKETLRIGRAVKYFKGIIGEVRLYNRVLTPIEIQHNYLVTKWRYR